MDWHSASKNSGNDNSRSLGQRSAVFSMQPLTMKENSPRNISLSIAISRILLIDYTGTRKKMVKGEAQLVMINRRYGDVRTSVCRGWCE